MTEIYTERAATKLRTF